jgi:hypothetical protein
MMSEVIKEEWTELAAESRNFAKMNESFFKEKAPKGKPEEPEIEDRELEEMAQIAEVREKVDDEILGYPNVVGTATGYKIRRKKVTPELCIQVLVEKKIKPLGKVKDLGFKPISKKIEDVLTDVVEVGRIEALPFKGRYKPAFPGASIGHYAITAGTFGCMVQDKVDHDFLILSNNHVLSNSNNARVGDLILQPGRYDGGSYRRDGIARLVRYVPLAAPYNLVDAAVAKPLDQRLVIASIPRLGIPRDTDEARIGMTCMKAGRTTQLTSGRVVSANASVRVGYGSGVTYLFKNQIITTRIGAPGDSGSLLVGPGRKAVGLLFAGSSVATIHNHISNVLMGLKVEMVTA